MNIQTSIKEWIEKRVEEEYAELEDFEISLTGEIEDVTPPCIRIFETGQSLHETGGVVMYGVTDFEMAVEMATVPAEAADEGTPTDDDLDARKALYNIIADRSGIDWMSERNGWRIFDIRLSSPITEPNEGRRVTRLELQIVACPITT